LLYFSYYYQYIFTAHDVNTERDTNNFTQIIIRKLIHSSVCVLKFHVARTQIKFCGGFPYQIKDSTGLVQTLTDIRKNGIISWLLQNHVRTSDSNTVFNNIDIVRTCEVGAAILSLKLVPEFTAVTSGGMQILQTTSPGNRK